MVAQTPKSTVIEPNTLASPNASGAYMRVTIGVSRIPKICVIIGADVRVMTSSAKDFLFFKSLTNKIV
jgi:hypothetical protein